jgi:hypothetical protein
MFIPVPGGGMPFIHGKSTFADIGLQPPPPPDKAPNGERRKLRSSRPGPSRQRLS